jgi:hypothetical protein
MLRLRWVGHRTGALSEVARVQGRRLSRPSPLKWKPNVADVRLAIIGDTHLPRGSRRLPEECVSRLVMADLILHTGDHCSAVSLEELRALGPPVEAVSGNADEDQLRATLPQLGRLPRDHLHRRRFERA